ncbi:cytochrome P450, partial [Mycena vulgaris]
LLRLFLLTPERFMEHLRQWASDIVMSVAYRIDVLPVGDPYTALAYAAGPTLAKAGVPGKYLVNSLPILKYVPSWLPGAGFKRKAKEWRKLTRAMADVPLAETRRQMELGMAPPSFTADRLQALKDLGGHILHGSTVKGTAGTIYIGGADNSVSAVATFIIGMLANPDAQRKAQAKVDSVTGGRRLPDLKDEAGMLYVAAVVKEVLRWKNGGPIAIPHFLEVEDEYRGYRILAGSLVIGITWAILHDKVTYPDPYAINPDHFLLDGKPNPAVQNPDAGFDYGRRLCAGRQMALASVWISITSVLAAFNITKALDEHGRGSSRRTSLTRDSSSTCCGSISSDCADRGLASAPLPFKCTMHPRSEEAVALILAKDESQR